MNDYWGAGNFDAYIWYWSGDPDPNYQLFVFTSEQCGAWSDGCWKDPSSTRCTRSRRHDGPDERQELVSRGAALRIRADPGRRARLPGLARRHTAATGSRAGCRRRATTATCCPATTTTRCVAAAPRRRTSRSAGVLARRLPGWIWARRRPRPWSASRILFVVARRGAEQRGRPRRGLAGTERSAWGRGGTSSARWLQAADDPALRADVQLLPVPGASRRSGRAAGAQRAPDPSRRAPAAGGARPRPAARRAST